jgi:hypothetical protein
LRGPWWLVGGPNSADRTRQNCIQVKFMDVIEKVLLYYKHNISC